MTRKQICGGKERKGRPNLAHESRLKVDLRIAAGGLASAGTIVVPQRKLIDRLGHGIEDASLATAIQTSLCCE
jgi:hypothetical protein